MKLKFKKLIPLLLSVVMCGSMVAGCTNGEGNLNNDPPAHTSHTYVYTDKNDDQHTKTCSGCSDINVDENHRYTDENDTTCNDCGHVREVGGGEEHTSHTYVYTDNNDGTTHTRTCSGCDEVHDTLDHVYTNAQDDTCNDCGHKREVGGGEEHKHTYVYAKKNDTHHTKSCSGCEEVNEDEVHVYDDDNDATCNKCGYERTIGGGEQGEVGGETFTGKIYLVGDSTVCSFNDKYYLPRYGYGTQIKEYFNVTSDVVNLALSGRSSKSFLTESNYTTLTSSIADGDVLIIGFGHNDEKSDEAARYTDANGTYQQPTTTNGDSFAYILYEYYVKVAKDAGATPILCTPIVRYDNSGSYSGAKIHDTTSSDKLGKGGDYAKAIKDLGAATDTTVIDLTSLTKAVYEADNEKAAYFHAHTSYEGDPVETITGAETPTGRDDTHINKYGAKMVAYQFANALKKSGNDFAKYTKLEITAPTYDSDYVDAINKAYVKPNYTPFDASKHAANKLVDDWYKTAMGALGGNSISPFEISYSNGVFTVGNASGNKGKIEANADGFAAAFVQISVTKNFVSSATVKVKSHTKSNTQAAFGMMLRDDILVDTPDDTLASNYVAAAALSKPGVIFSRESGTLSSVKNSMDAFVVDSSYEISIERVGQTVKVKFGNIEATYTDFDFVARDNDYMYLCLFATRSTVVEFSNVVFNITGDAQGA